jgi:hypothetical protein
VARIQVKVDTMLIGGFRLYSIVLVLIRLRLEY